MSKGIVDFVGNGVDYDYVPHSIIDYTYVLQAERDVLKARIDTIKSTLLAFSEGLDQDTAESRAEEAVRVMNSQNELVSQLYDRINAMLFALDKGFDMCADSEETADDLSVDSVKSILWSIHNAGVEK